ncbi:MAG TPA: Calx-beta domain-containing protein [Thermoanaerobaculia bacterium]|nr:Calx-beta domain-containing protein [Thermoanaerobaculia bacterium]
MRISAAALLGLSILVFSADAHAQCQPIWRLEKLRVTNEECTTTHGTTRCKAGIPLKLEVDAIHGAGSCPPDLTWDLGDGSPPVRTTEPRLTYTFGAGNMYIRVRDTAQPDVFAGLNVESLWGRFSARAEPGSVDEGEGPVRVTVSRDDSSRLATIDYRYAGAPYVQSGSGTFVFEPGQSEKSIVIPILDDGVYHGASTFVSFSLANVSGGYGYANGGASFVVHDDDPPVGYRFAQRGIRVSEGAGTLNVDVLRSGDLSGTTRAVVQGMFGSHFVTFGPGEARATLTLPVVDDPYYTGSQRGKIQCFGELAQEHIDEIEVEITEDEPTPTFSPRTVEIQESDTTREVPIQVFVTPWLAGHTFFVEATPGTANAQDFSHTSGYVSWGPWSNTVTLFATITGDDVPESDETFDLELDGPFRHTVTVRIVDDDRPTFGFAFDVPNYEESEETAAVKVVRNGPPNEAARVTLNFRPHATVVWPDPIVLDFAPGEMSKNVPLGTGDGFYTGTRTATLELDWSGFTGDAAELILFDDEEMPSLSISDASVVEGAAGTISKAEIELTLSAPVGSALAVGLAAAPGTADASDYIAANPPGVLLPGALSVRVPISVRGDGEQETDEMFTVSIASCCDGLAKIERSTATITIRNDDGGDSAAYRIESAPEYRESAGWLVASVTRTDAATAASVTVKLTADATRPFPPVTVRFQPGQSRREVRFFLDDPYHSGDAAATLEVFSGARRDDKRDLIIREDEARPVIAMAETTSYVRGGEWATAVFPLTIVPPSAHPLEVNVTSVVTREISASELEAVNRDLVIPPHTTRVEIPVQTRIDRFDDDRRVFEMGLVLLTPTKAVLATPSVAGFVLRDASEGKATLAGYDPLVTVGTARRLTVTLPVVAVSADPIAVISSAPNVVAVPPNVTAATGSAEISFDASALSDGDAKVTIALPESLGKQVFEVWLEAYTIRTPAATPGQLVLRPGELGKIRLFSTPAPFDPFEATMEARDGSVVFTQRSVQLHSGGPVEFEVYGANVGRTEIVITLPAGSGHTTLAVPVEVVETAPRRRSAGR